jgi:hypothetical protein
LLANLPQFEPLKDARKTYTRCVKAVLVALEHVIANRTADSVATRFDSLCEKLGQLYTPSDDTISRAHRRKLLGKPPTSPGQGTIGDEVNWELLLECCEEDLVICSGDTTYLNNASTLAQDYATQRRRLLGIREKFTDAMNLIGESPSLEAVKQEEALEKDIAKLRFVTDPDEWIHSQGHTNWFSALFDEKHKDKHYVKHYVVVYPRPDLQYRGDYGDDGPPTANEH